MTISQALSNAASGLFAASRRAGVTSGNIANALTEGYHRRDVVLAERVTGGVGAGVSVAGVQRATDFALLSERRNADGQFAFENSVAGALTQVSRLIGDSEDPSALFRKFANFAASLRALGDTPDSASAQNAVLNSAKDLAAAFNGLAGSLQQIRTNADAEIGQRVTAVNDALKQIEILNRDIGRGQNIGADIAALQDQRQRLIDQVNESIPVREVVRGDGGVDLVTQEGVFLIAGSARTVTFAPSPVVTAQSVYGNGSGALSGLSVDGVDITPGGGSGQAPADGALAGLFSVRDNVVPAAALQLDALALDIAQRLSDAGVDPTITPGSPGVFTDSGALATDANIVGLAGRLRVNAAVDPAQGGALFRLRDGVGAATAGAAGADGLIRNIIAALDAPRSTPVALGAGGDLSAAEAFAHLSAVVGGARASAAVRRDTTQALAASLRDAEQSATGVDTDQELQRLLSIEQAYAANARVIETVDRLLQRLLEI